MREIIYRCWDKKSKKYRNVNSIVFNGNSTTCGDNLPNVVNSWGEDIIAQKDVLIHREKGEYTLEQYTGLKDKNGDRIFTGHIVTIFGVKYTVIFEYGSFGLASHDCINYKPFEEHIFEITGCNNRPYYTYNDNFLPLWEIYWNFNCEDDSIELIEIIGNIHDKD